jgi:hypothetical protein
MLRKSRGPEDNQCSFEPMRLRVDLIFLPEGTLG